METRDDVLIWAENFDTEKYSSIVYQELVINGRAHPSKFKIMGAWKTGCLKPNRAGNDYIDENNECYSFTSLWKDHIGRVGKKNWDYINDHIQDILPQIPVTCPVLIEPIILKDLKGRVGFGFIWGLFTLHCCYPGEYPLYDQHVYRAFKSIEPDGKPLPLQASNQWKDFIAYKEFFELLLAKYEVNHWVLDRALWSYGKWLKQGITIAKNKGKSKFNPTPKTFYHKDDSWKQEYTLGGKKKPFLSKIDEDSTLIIKRKFKDNPNDIISSYTIDDMMKIQMYMKENNWIPLANNVERMENGSEISGLGSFVFNNIKQNGVFAQSTSQLAAIFIVSGVWEMTKLQVENKGNKRMVFKYRNINWREALDAYYVEEDSE